MVVASVLLWANLQTHYILAGPGSTAYGWPYLAYGTQRIRQPELVGSFYIKHLIYDILVTAAILAATGIFCEWFFRSKRRSTTR